MKLRFETSGVFQKGAYVRYIVDDDDTRPEPESIGCLYPTGGGHWGIQDNRSNRRCQTKLGYPEPSLSAAMKRARQCFTETGGE